MGRVVPVGGRIRSTRTPSQIVKFITAPDPSQNRILFPVSRQNQYKLGFSEEKSLSIELRLYRDQRFLANSTIKFIKKFMILRILPLPPRPPT